MKTRVMVHNRTGIQGQPVPLVEDSIIEIPKHLHDKVLKIQELASELNDSRLELGRLMQVVDHLITVCHTTEKNLTKSKEHLVKEMSLEDANWAIDFSNLSIGKVANIPPKTPRVV